MGVRKVIPRSETLIPPSSLETLHASLTLELLLGLWSAVWNKSSTLVKVVQESQEFLESVTWELLKGISGEGNQGRSHGASCISGLRDRLKI